LLETLKKSFGLVDRIQIKVRIGSLRKNQSSKLINFPKICPACHKTTKEESKIETTFVQIQRTRGKEKKERVEKISFDVPMCKKCSKKRKKANKYLPTEASPIMILIILFYVGRYAGEIRDTIMNLIPSYLEFYAFALILPLMLIITYIIERRTEEPIIISEISVGKDNPRLLERLTKMQDAKENIVQAKLNPKNRSSITFSFRDPQYATLFVKENKTLLV
jgi:hypothetical protein